MAPHHRRQVGMLDGDRPMPVVPAPVRHPRQRSGIAALGRDLPDHVDPFARLAPDMGEAKEVERGAPRSRVVGALRPLEAEVDEARLVGMEREPIPGKTLAQNSQDPRGIGKGLESHHEIVGVPDKAGSSLQAWSDRVFEPHIQHMVQVDVRKARGGHPSHDGAKLPFDLAVTIPRDRLRPQYGDGFLGAPLLLCRPSKMQWPDHGGADATAQDKSPNPQGPGEP